MEILDRLDQMIDERHLLKHPFYTKWTEGTLPIDAMREYARQYFAFESAMPLFLSAIHSRTEDAAVRQQILDNLWDEEHGPDNHAELWLRFAEGIGVDREDVRSAERNPATEALVETYQDITRGSSVAAGVAALYAYERQVPQTSESKIQGLERNYGVADSRSIAFFKVHGVLDVAHSEAEREVLGQLIEGTDEREVEDATRRALDAWWNFLSAVDQPAAVAVA